MESLDIHLDKTKADEFGNFSDDFKVIMKEILIKNFAMYMDIYERKSIQTWVNNSLNLNDFPRGLCWVKMTSVD